jgi:hypothetical protein
VARIIRHALARSEKKENELEKEAQERSGQRQYGGWAGSHLASHRTEGTQADNNDYKSRRRRGRRY